GRRLGWPEGIDDRYGAGLGDVAKRLFLDRGQAAPDVSLRGLRPEQIGARGLDLGDVFVVERLELSPHLVVCAASGDQVLPTGELRGLTKDDGATIMDVPVDDLRDGRTAAQAGCGVRLATLDRDQKLLPFDRLATQL